VRSAVAKDFYSIDEMNELADRMEARAKAGKVVHLTPDSAKVAALGLRALAAYPMRSQLVSIICGLDRCKDRRSCYECFGKANAIMHLYEGRRR